MSVTREHHFKIYSIVPDIQSESLLKLTNKNKVCFREESVYFYNGLQISLQMLNNSNPINRSRREKHVLVEARL